MCPIFPGEKHLTNPSAAIHLTKLFAAARSVVSDRSVHYRTGSVSGPLSTSTHLRCPVLLAGRAKGYNASLTHTCVPTLPFSFLLRLHSRCRVVGSITDVGRGCRVRGRPASQREQHAAHPVRERERGSGFGGGPACSVRAFEPKSVRFSCSLMIRISVFQRLLGKHAFPSGVPEVVCCCKRERDRLGTILVHVYKCIR